MDQSIAIGPLGLQVSVLVTLAALVLGWYVAGRVGRAQGLKLDAPLYAVTGAGLLGARLAFVAQHGAAYLQSPVSMLDVRDGGWSAWAGFAAAALAAALLALRRRALALPLAAGLAVAAGLWAGAAGVSASLGSPTKLPALTLRTLDGRELQLQRLEGRPVVLNLWATWCPPCIREMPVLAQGQKQRADVLFLFVNQGETPQQVQSFLARRGLAIDNVLLDANGQVARELGAQALPTTMFVDAQGRPRAARIGELTAAMLAARLAEVAPAGSPE